MTLTDLCGRDLTEVKLDDIPKDTEYLDLSNNKISCLPSDIFRKRFNILSINLKNNNISNLSFLRVFKVLKMLNIENNNLEVDDLLNIRHLYIQDLRIKFNGFYQHFATKPLVLVTILKRVWIIDGQFITDYVKQSAREYKRTLEYAEAILGARKEKNVELKFTGATKAVANFLKGSSLKNDDIGLFMHPKGIMLQSYTKRPQLEKLAYLAGEYEMSVPDGDFIDIFALILGILSVHWANMSIDLIPRLLARPFWGLKANDIEKLENWEQWVYLYKLNEIISPRTNIEVDLWKMLRLDHYLKTGEIPLPGSNPKLLLTALLYRAVDPDDYPNNINFKLYQKFREHCGFTSLDEGLSVIHYELLGALPDTIIAPKIGEVVAITNPVDDKWTNCIVAKVSNGRTWVKIGNIIIQIPVRALFWDGRGIFREAKPREIKQNKASKLHSAFLTEARTTLTNTEEMRNLSRKSASVQARFPPLRVASRLLVEKTLSSLSNVQSSPKVSKITTSVQSTYDENSDKNLKKTRTLPSTFRGILSPICPPHICIPKVPPSRKSNQYVEGVVNITLGHMGADGRQMRRFHVKVVNSVSKKVQYIWINEDEVTEDDVSRLLELYKSLIESKMHVVTEDNGNVTGVNHVEL